ncbi:NAD(P)/FAD-dependent oxidoreductase [Hyphomicrobium facile]|uniref:2-polyprenyl-6-methoxyphenol hydroxylase n=1 Tax=Hyphomicrobium facile TaxID=51670 RepID=A0A1I7NUW4_9HYPH|nr:FAD-dependent oxidoreductase [Hyphomicrobium facile]SFV38447.1 2-polyprenyl-6-methoxyphenol hydroxylase [Hyphomicrobium facile]
MHEIRAAQDPAKGGGSPVSDVTIIGAGAAGSMAAIVLARRGISVTLVDMRAKHPPEFRCEKIVDDQLDLIEQLQLLDLLKPVSTRVDRMLVVRPGNIQELRKTTEYGFSYQDFINSLRAGVPGRVRFVNERVAKIRNGEETQIVELADGETLSTRLVLLATGLAQGLRQNLGMTLDTVHHHHSLCVGFSLRPGEGQKFNFPALTYYSERLESGIAYITLFPMGDVMRANLFTYHGYQDPFVAQIRNDPVSALYGAMPGLQKFLGSFERTDEVRIRMIDLDRVANHRQHGVVLIGDAFQTSCPATGTGLTRCMNDVARLSEHIDRWLATPGMSRGKLASFYDDPRKTSVDDKATYAAHYARKFATDRRLSWDLRRIKTVLRSRFNIMEDSLAERLRLLSAS